MAFPTIGGGIPGGLLGAPRVGTAQRMGQMYRPGTPQGIFGPTMPPPGPVPAMQQPVMTVPLPQQPQGFMGRMQGAFQDNPMTMMALASGMLANRRNANVNPLDGVMQASLVDRESGKERREEERETQRSNSTIDWLVKYRGMSEDEARATVESGMVSEALKPSGGDATDDMREYQFAKQEGFEGTFSDWQKQGGAEGGGVYGTPIYGTNTDGTPSVGVIGKDGSFVPLDTGKFNVSPNIEKVDLGTEWGFYDKRLGQITRREPKDVAGAAAAEVRGKAQGEAQVKLGGDLQKAEQALGLIEKMEQHPGRGTATGLSGTLDPRNYFAGTNAGDFHVMNQQLQGKAFLEAFESLKGGGAISEREGQAATAAIARLSTAQSDEAYLAALADLRGVLTAGIERSKQRAGVAPAAAPQQGVRRYNPVTGQIE